MDDHWKNTCTGYKIECNALRTEGRTDDELSEIADEKYGACEDQNMKRGEDQKPFRWCPLKETCINDTNCRLADSFLKRDDEKSYYPWGDPCGKTEDGKEMKYCKLLSLCLPPDKKCSLKLLFDWLDTNDITEQPTV